MERVLVAYLVGALLGGCAFLIERVSLASSAGLTAAAIYTLAAGTLAASSRSLAELWRPGRGGRVACLMAVATCGALHLSYFVNVKLLPGEPYWTLRSLVGDTVVVVGVLLLAGWAMRSSRAQAIRLRFGRAAAWAGALALGTAVTIVAAGWPAFPASAATNGKGPDLLLVVLDSARRDHIGLYGHTHPTSPELDRWAPRARVFTRAHSASSWTVPSVRAFLEGGLAMGLSRHGYATACFTDNPHLSFASPLLAGFQHTSRSVARWRHLVRGSVLGETVERLAPGDDDTLVTRSLEWLDRQEASVFLYVHLMDSHTPYRHATIDGRRRGGRQIEFPAAGLDMTDEEVGDVVARYDGGLHSADRAAGRLLAAVEARGRPWLAIVTSDHGESLGESGRWFHGGSLAQELLEIPLLVAGTNVKAGRFDGVVGHPAIPMTFAAAAGLPCLACAENDLRTSSGSGRADGGLPPYLTYRIEGAMKVVRDAEHGRLHLFNLERDLLERYDLSTSQPALAEKLAAGLTPFQMPRALSPSADVMERLRSVGYAGETLGTSGSR